MGEDYLKKSDEDSEAPTHLAEEVASLIRHAHDSEDADEILQHTDGRFRDRDLEKEQAKDMEVQVAESALEHEKEMEAALIDEIRGTTRKERTKKQAKSEVKGVKDNKKARVKEVKQATKDRKQRRKEFTKKISERRGGIFAAAKRVMKKIANYKAHAIMATGDQAGLFDNGKEGGKKRGVTHDFGLTEVVVKRFTTTVNGVEVSGTISTNMKDIDGDGVPDRVSESEVRVDSASVGGYNVSADKLGAICPDAVRASLENSAGGIAK